MRFADATYFHLLWLLPVLALFYAYAFRRKRRALAMFGNPLLMAKMTATTSKERQTWKAVLVLVGTGFVILTVVRPQFGTKLKVAARTGVDVIIALDTSASMLAEDVKPSRLERAKYEISAFIDHLEGDRVGLVAFSGGSFVQCPLTLDYGAAKLFLEVLDARTIPVPGTDISGAIGTAMRAFNIEERKYKVVVLLTDGEDHQGDPTKAAKEAAEQGIRIHTIGFGTRDGELIREYNPDKSVKGYKQDREGNIVKTRLDEKTLERIALLTEGSYHRGSVGETELDEIYREISQMEKKELQSKRFAQYEDRFQYFLLWAIVALGAEVALSDRKRIKKEWTGRFD